MTPTEINITIAEHLGWTEPRGAPDATWMKHPDSRPTSNPFGIAPVPNYHGDLNATCSAEETLTVHQKKDQIENAVRIVFREHGVTASAYFATAVQRAEAFLRTIGKWVD
jgi:hypothetical protein